MATEQCDEELINLLLEAGASTSEGDNCLDISMTKHFLKGVEIFRNTKFAQKEIFDGFGYMVRLREMGKRVDLEFEEDILGFMSESGDEVHGLPALHHACGYRHENPDIYQDPWEMVQLLLEVITDIHRRDMFGFNCLQHACSRLHLRTVKVLLSHGVTSESHGWSKMWKCLPPVNENTVEIYPRFLNLLRFAGFHVDAETVGKLEQSMIVSGIDEKCLVDLKKVLRACNSPVNLKAISATKVRQCLGGKIDDRLKESIPEVLIDYLKFDHLY